jgi:hypothetical protein
MAAGIQILALIASLVASSAALGDPSAQTDAAFASAFQCPEGMASDNERRQALVDYFRWTQARHPDWSVADAIEFKKTLLVRHQCAASLRDLADYTKREEKVVPPK